MRRDRISAGANEAMAIAHGFWPAAEKARPAAFYWSRPSTLVGGLDMGLLGELQHLGKVFSEEFTELSMLICFGSTPSLASFSRNAGSFSASCVTSCSLSTMLRGVLAGADSPFQKRKTAFGYPASAIDGTSGRSDIRLGELTARRESLSLCSAEAAAAMGMK